MSDRRLDPCPSTPNCVSTQAPESDAEHRAEPVSFTGSAEDAMTAVREVVAAYPRTEVQVDEPRYVHAVFRTRIMRYKDDVEFLVDDEAKLVHYRSASRVGSSDLGANRKRMDELTAQLRQRLG